MATNNVLTNPGIHARLEGLASFVARYGLVVVIAWIGALKFTAYEPRASSHWSPTAHC